MFGLGEASARETKVSNYVNHLNLLLADIRQAPLAPQRPASVNAAEQQFLQFSDKAIEYSPFTDMSDADFADFIAYGDDVNQAMNEILADLTPASVDPDEPMVAGAKPKLDVGKLVAGLTVVGVLGYVVWKFSKPAVPAFAGFGALPPSRRDEPVGDPTWENRFGYGPREVEGVNMFRNKTTYMYTPFKHDPGRTLRNPMPSFPRGGNEPEEVAQRLLKTKEWKGSTMVDVGDVIEIRHPSGAVARINKARPVKKAKRGRR